MPEGLYKILHPFLSTRFGFLACNRGGTAATGKRYGRCPAVGVRLHLAGRRSHERSPGASAVFADSGRRNDAKTSRQRFFVHAHADPK